MLCLLEDLLDSVATIREYTILCLNFQEKVAKKLSHALELSKTQIVWNINSLHLQYLDFAFCIGEHLKTSASERMNMF